MVADCSSGAFEDFDAVEEAFKLLDVENKNYLTVDTFKQIFEKLDLGEIAPSDEDIFKEVADFDGDGVINLDDFRSGLWKSGFVGDGCSFGIILPADIHNPSRRLLSGCLV